MPNKKTQRKGRLCETKGCAVVLSIYNPATMCAKCWAEVPLTKRPYKYGDGF